MFRDYNNVRACLAIMIRVRTFVIVVAVFVVGFLFWTLTVFVCASARADEEKAILAIRSLGGSVMQESILPDFLTFLPAGESCFQRVESIYLPVHLGTTRENPTDEVIKRLRQFKYLRVATFGGSSRKTPNAPPKLDLVKVRSTLPSVLVVRITE